MSFAISCFPSSTGVLNHGQDFVLSHDEELRAVERDLLARVLAKQDQVAWLDVERNARAVVSDGAASDGNHGPSLRLFFAESG
jgi:hypothetical protein